MTIVGGQTKSSACETETENLGYDVLVSRAESCQKKADKRHATLSDCRCQYRVIRICETSVDAPAVAAHMDRHSGNEYKNPNPRFFRPLTGLDSPFAPVDDCRCTTVRSTRSDGTKNRRASQRR